MACNDPVRFLICDREFHLTIYYASPNRLLADFVVDLYTYMLDHRRIAMAQPGAIEKSLEDHRFIVRALKMRNPDAVRRPSPSISCASTIPALRSMKEKAVRTARPFRHGQLKGVRLT